MPPALLSITACLVLLLSTAAPCSTWFSRGSAPPPATPSVTGELTYVDRARNLVVRDLRSGSQRSVAVPPGIRISRPAWSPDGASLAFLGAPDTDAPANQVSYTVYVASPADLSARPVSDGAFGASVVEWVPPGHAQLVLSSPLRLGQIRLLLFDLETGNTQTVSTSVVAPNFDQATPAVARDGRRVAYWQRSDFGAGNEKTALILADLGSDASRTLVAFSTNGVGFAPRWTPDQQSVAYVEGARVMAVDAASGQQTAMLTLADTVSAPLAFSASGDMVALRTQTGTREARSGRVAPDFHLAIRRADGQQVVAQAQPGPAPTTPVRWVGDAGALFVPDTSAARQVWFLDARTGAAASVADIDGVSFDWRPN